MAIEANEPIDFEWITWSIGDLLGVSHSTVRSAVDPNSPTSVVSALADAGTTLGLMLR